MPAGRVTTPTPGYRADDTPPPDAPPMDADADCPIAVAPVPACGTE